MLDILGILLLVLSFFRGYRKGLIVALFSVLGVILGMLAALKLSSALATYFLEHNWVTSAWAQIIAYLLLFLGVLWLVRLGARLIESAVKAVMLGLVNRLCGGILYMFIGATIWSSLLWIANKAHIISPESITASHTYVFFEPLAPWVFSHIGTVLPFARDIFSDLQHFFDGVNTHLPGHVGTP